MTIIDEFIWDKQEYDTEAGYRVFRIYLEQYKTTRNLTAAYRAYLLKYSDGHTSLEDVAKIYCPRFIRFFANGQDTYGNVVEGRPTWKERATEYDNYQDALEQARQKEKQKELYLKEQKDYESLNDFWDYLFSELKEKDKKTIEKTKRLPTEIINKFEKLVKTRSDITENKRMAYGLTRQTRSVDIEADEDGNISIEWVDPL